MAKEGNYCPKDCNYTAKESKYLAKEGGCLTKMFSGILKIVSLIEERDNFPSWDVFLVSWCLCGKKVLHMNATKAQRSQRKRFWCYTKCTKKARSYSK